MKYYANFNSIGALVEINLNPILADEFGSTEVINTEVPEELYLDYKQDPLKYIAGTKEIEIDVPDYDEEEQPIMVEVEETVTDEEGNEQTVTNQVQSTHKETITIPYPVINPNYEEEQAQKEKERIAKLSLTKREVFLALYKAKQITPEMIKAQIGQNVEAMIEFEYAEKYYRFNPLIDTIGGMLGYTSEDLDYLFEHKEFPSQEESEEE